MTPVGIKTGRQFQSTTTIVTLGSGVTTKLVDGHSDRVGLVVSVGILIVADMDGFIAIGLPNAGSVIALTALSPGHPTCYLSVDKIGNALFPAIFAVNNSSIQIDVGVTDVRQIQPLEGL